MTPFDEDAEILIDGRFLYFLSTNLGVGIVGGGFISPIYHHSIIERSQLRCISSFWSFLILPKESLKFSMVADRAFTT